MSEYPYDIELSDAEVIYLQIKLKMVADDIYENNIHPLQASRSLQPFIGKLLRLYFIEPEVFDVCNKYLDSAIETDIREQLNRVLQANAKVNTIADQLTESVNNAEFFSGTDGDTGSSDLSESDLAAFDTANGGIGEFKQVGTFGHGEVPQGVSSMHDSEELKLLLARVNGIERQVSETERLRTEVERLTTLVERLARGEVGTSAEAPESFVVDVKEPADFALESEIGSSVKESVANKIADIDSIDDAPKESVAEIAVEAVPEIQTETVAEVTAEPVLETKAEVQAEVKAVPAVSKAVPSAFLRAAKSIKG